MGNAPTAKNKGNEMESGKCFSCLTESDAPRVCFKTCWAAYLDSILGGWYANIQCQNAV